MPQRHHRATLRTSAQPFRQRQPRPIVQPYPNYRLLVCHRCGFSRYPPPSGATCENFAFGPLTDATTAAGAGLRNRQQSVEWKDVAERLVSTGSGEPPPYYLQPNPVTPSIPTPNSCTNPRTGQPGSGTDGAGHFWAWVDYSSYQNAYVATKAYVYRMLGVPNSVWQAFLTKNNLTWVSYTDLKQHVSNYINFNGVCNSNDGNSYVVRDAMIVRDDASTVFKRNHRFQPGFALTMSHKITATPKTTLYLNDLATYIQKQKFGGRPLSRYFYTKPYTNSMTDNGLNGDTMDVIKSDFGQLVGLYLLDSNNQCNVQSAFNNSVAAINGKTGVNMAQIVVTVDMLWCSGADALDLFYLNSQQHLGGYMIFPNQASMGGQTMPLSGPNLLIWNLLYGPATSPPTKFPHPRHVLYAIDG